MVEYCHGGNMPASHDNGISDDNVGDDKNVYLLVLVLVLVLVSNLKLP